MAQVIPPNYPQSFGEGALKGISQTLPDALNAYLERQRKQEELKQEDVALKSLGYDVGGVRNPRLRELLLEGKQKEKKELADFSADSKNYSTINDAFGEKFANVWKASDRGARTELVKSALDATLRGLDINELFSSSELTDLPEKDQISEAKTIEKPIETFEDPFKNKLTEISADWVEDSKFVQDLFVHTLQNDAKYQEMIADRTKNWESERIALMDTILMKMAICELLNFPSIPVKVTINEYLELSKDYSTPKSNSFINGILDKILGDLKKNNTIKKIGRGLIED